MALLIAVGVIFTLGFVIGWNLSDRASTKEYKQRLANLMQVHQESVDQTAAAHFNMGVEAGMKKAAEEYEKTDNEFEPDHNW